MVSIDALSEMATTVRAPDDQLVAAECRGVSAGAAALLRRCVRQLPSGDRRLLDLRFNRSVSLAHSARTLNVPYRLLYRRTSYILRRLRRDLEASGYHGTDVLIGIDAERS
jgi:DNA-directed RNA polymerase specialized sigma24 family protein